MGFVQKMKENNMEKKLIPKKVLNNFLQNKQVIKDYLQLKGLQNDDLTQSSSLELWTACLMGKVTEVERRCLENIEALSEVRTNSRENIYLIMEFLAKSWFNLTQVNKYIILNDREELLAIY